jgi:hypothetical protein
MRANLGIKRRLAGDWANRPVIREIHLRELSSVIDRSSHLVMPDVHVLSSVKVKLMVSGLV